MPVQAELGVVGEVGAELQKERAEVSVHAIDVEAVHHGCGADQPGIAHPGLFVPSSLGAEHRSFFLSLADQHQSYEFYEALKRSGATVEIAVYPQTYHYASEPQ